MFRTIIKKITRYIAGIVCYSFSPVFRLVHTRTVYPVSFLIVTYYGRFDNFKKIIKKLDLFYPQITKTIIINGRNDDSLAQEEFLKEIENFLSKYKNLIIIKHTNFVCQAKLWNDGIMRSPTERIIILNDSVTIVGPFLNRYILSRDFLKINNSYSNYLISKKIIAKIGWFDENFIAGATVTDGDLEARLVLGGLVPEQKKSLFIFWKKFVNVITWDKKLQGVIDKKTTGYNQEYFAKKWNFSKDAKEGYFPVGITNGYVQGPNPGFETPNPHPEVLAEWRKEYGLI